MRKLPKGVTAVSLDDPATLHNTIAEAVGEPKLRPMAEVEMANDFDGEALRQIAVLAEGHARTLQRFARNATERSAIWKFSNLATACRRVIEMQRRPS